MNFVYIQKTVQNSLGIASPHPQTQSADMNTRLYNNASCCHLSISVAKFRLFVLFRNQFSAPSVLTARPFYLIMYKGGVYIGEGLSLKDLHYAERFCFSKTAFTVFFTVSKSGRTDRDFFPCYPLFPQGKELIC